jgi:hypothetical protein
MRDLPFLPPPCPVPGRAAGSPEDPRLGQAGFGRLMAGKAPGGLGPPCGTSSRARHETPPKAPRLWQARFGPLTDDMAKTMRREASNQPSCALKKGPASTFHGRYPFCRRLGHFRGAPQGSPKTHAWARLGSWAVDGRQGSRGRHVEAVINRLSGRRAILCRRLFQFRGAPQTSPKGPRLGQTGSGWLTADKAKTMRREASNQPSCVLEKGPAPTSRRRLPLLPPPWPLPGRAAGLPEGPRLGQAGFMGGAGRYGENNAAGSFQSAKPRSQKRARVHFSWPLPFLPPFRCPYRFSSLRLRL